MSGSVCGTPSTLNPDRCSAGSDDTDIFCSSVGKVNNTPLDKRPPVIEAHYRFLAIAKVLNPDENTERQRLMSRSHGMHIVDFAIAGFAAVKIPSVPAGQPFFRISPTVEKRVVALPCHHIGLLPVFQALGFGRIDDMVGRTAGHDQKSHEQICQNFINNDLSLFHANRLFNLANKVDRLKTVGETPNTFKLPERFFSFSLRSIHLLPKCLFLNTRHGPELLIAMLHQLLRREVFEFVQMFGAGIA